MKKKRVLKAFNVASKNYDNYRKQAIPNMQIFYNTAIELTKEYENPKTLDLGAGTGILSELLLKRHPESNIALLDMSDKMLNIAKDKFKNNQNIEYIEADYLEHEFSKYDIIISSLSIHHLTNSDKNKLYEKIYDALEYNGTFINADLSLGSTDTVEESFKNKDQTHLEKQLIPEEEKIILTDRRKLDKPDTIENTIKNLKDIGFNEVEIYYKYFRYYVVKAKKYPK